MHKSSAAPGKQQHIENWLMWLLLFFCFQFIFATKDYDCYSLCCILVYIQSCFYFCNVICRFAWFYTAVELLQLDKLRYTYYTFNKLNVIFIFFLNWLNICLLLVCVVAVVCNWLLSSICSISICEIIYN